MSDPYAALEEKVLFALHLFDGTNRHTHTSLERVLEHVPGIAHREGGSRENLHKFARSLASYSTSAKLTPFESNAFYLSSSLLRAVAAPLGDIALRQHWIPLNRVRRFGRTTNGGGVLKEYRKGVPAAEVTDKFFSHPRGAMAYDNETEAFFGTVESPFVDALAVVEKSGIHKADNKTHSRLLMYLASLDVRAAGVFRGADVRTLLKVYDAFKKLPYMNATQGYVVRSKTPLLFAAEEPVRAYRNPAGGTFWVATLSPQSAYVMSEKPVGSDLQRKAVDAVQASMRKRFAVLYGA